MNHVVARLIARDPDGGRNGRISYAIDVNDDGGGSDGQDDGQETVSDGRRSDVVRRSEARFFDIDAEKGGLIVNRPLSEAGGKTIELKVVASDHGSPPKTARQILFVVVNKYVC